MAVLSNLYDAQNTNKLFNMIDNYIYMHHTDEFVVLPLYPDSITDSQGPSFASSQPLMRSAPIASYSNTGSRSINFSFEIHREYMTQINYQKSNLKLAMDDDYVDTLIKRLQACALPQYNSGEKMVDPPLVSVRIGDEIFIKGYLGSAPTVTYKTPIINWKGKDRYALIGLQISVTEVEPYSAKEVMKIGSFRGLSTSLERNLWKPAGSTSIGVGGLAGGSRAGSRAGGTSHSVMSVK